MSTSLAATALTKSYGGVRVLSDVAFDVGGGEVHALVGENGAGKSTLIKILGGAVRPDAGRVTLDDVPLPLGNPHDIRSAGLSIVYQEFTLVRDLSVADNIFLGREKGRPWLDRAAMAREVEQLFADLGVEVSPAAKVRSLSVAHQQLVEIARALSGEAKVLILDEPTAALSGREVDRLFAVVGRLKARGLGVVFVSHRFDEIFALADRITVLRDGRRVLESAASSLDRPALIRAMVGREVSEEFPPRPAAAGGPAEVALDVSGLTAPSRCREVSFSMRRGEIVGLAGLVGAGRTSVGLALVGAATATGTIHLGAGKTPGAVFASPAEALRGGVAYLTEDRKGRGLFPQMSTSANIAMASTGAFTRAGLLSLAREREAVTTTAGQVGVKIGALAQPAGTLSGGNQQKALVGRFLLRHPRVLIMDEPTRGVDVGARAEIYALMNRLTAQGLAILMISSDLPEVIGMSDRVLVMREGRVTGELARGAATPDTVMALATRS
jgi:ABC-type sugar transport system ATPase subunit